MPFRSHNVFLSSNCSRDKKALICYISKVKNQKIISESSPLEAPSRADIKRGMTIAAQLVQRYGPKYWPVLERLKQEYDVLDDREALLASLLSDADKAA